jgi:ribonuclease III
MLRLPAWLQRRSTNRTNGQTPDLAELTRDRAISTFVRAVSGFRPRDIAVYRLAFSHISTVSQSNLRAGAQAMYCNERLEFLGDAVLGSVIAEYLFQKFATRDEGFLTEMRSKIVNRASLNDISLRLGLDSMLNYDVHGNWSNRSIFGNTLEAFIGALYLDQGYTRARDFIVQRILTFHIDLDTLADTDTNYKSRLMELAQKRKLTPVSYEVTSERQLGAFREYTVACRVGTEIMGYGTDIKKKLAEQKASEKALAFLSALSPASA